jgi:UDP-2,3-diacylglucosamine pyrophosphatase LpxH
MHDKLLQKLLAVANRHGAALRVLATLTNDAFALPDDKEIRVFIPDLHLLGNARRALYRYGTNHEPMLLDVVNALAGLRADAAADEFVGVFHIGDYLDLWRQSDSPADFPVADAIRRDHAGLTQALENTAVFLYGNHDFDLCRNPACNDKWDRRYFIPDPTAAVMIMHGDYFDWIEMTLPQGIRDIGVYFFGKSHQPADEVVEDMATLTRRANQDQSGKTNAFLDYLQQKNPVPVGGQSTVGPVPDTFNIQNADASVAGGLTFLDKACAECERTNAESGAGIRTVIIGHTHHARIAQKKMADGGKFTLIDTGAWIENCCNADGTNTFPNAQITAISANQVRIYQFDLAPDESNITD